MAPPKHPNPAFPPHLLAELLALRPYIEHILCDGSCDPHIRAAAKDCTQTVLRKVVEHFPSYQPHEEGLRPWVTRIARNERIDVYRRAQHFDDTFGHDHIAADRAPSSDPSPEREAQVRALLDKVFALLEEMPSDMRDVLILAGSSEDAHGDIAAQFRISKGAAKMRLSRARKMLRERVGAYFDHVGVFLLLVLRKLGASRVPLLTRVRTFFWQAAHLLPPVYIGFVTLPQMEPTRAASAEYAVVVPARDERSAHVRDERDARNVAQEGRPIVEGPAVGPVTPNLRPSADVHASDKPRRRTPSRHVFNVDLPPTNTFMNGRQ